MATATKERKPVTETHTPGPWECGRVKPIVGVTTIRGWFIRPEGIGLDLAEVYLTASQSEETQGANARLIAASPDLLRIAEAYVEFADWVGDEVGTDMPGLADMVTFARTVIATIKTT